MNDSGVVQVGLSSLVGGFPQPWVLGGDQRPEMQPADFDSFRVTWAAPRGQSLAEWLLRERGEARAKAEGLRLPVAALLSGAR